MININPPQITTKKKLKKCSTIFGVGHWEQWMGTRDINCGCAGTSALTANWEQF